MNKHIMKLNQDIKQQLIKINLGASRKSQLAQGFFDGRFVTRAEQSKKTYTRKEKHRNRLDS